MTALTARTEPDERALTTREWAATARLLAGWCRWGSGQTWAAIRTAPHAMTLLADGAQHPEPDTLVVAAEAIRRIHRLASPGPSSTVHQRSVRGSAFPAVAAPMRILDARYDRWRHLRVLVDRVPHLDDLRFTPYAAPELADIRIRRHPGPLTLYAAAHPGGYVTFLLDTGDGLGFNGEPFDLNLADGTSRVVVGPWSSSVEYVSRHLPAVDVFPAEFTVHEDVADFHASRDGRVLHLTRAAARQSIHLAANASAPVPHPAALTRAFEASGAGSTTGPGVSRPRVRAVSGRARLDGTSATRPRGPRL
jgi:hypothetical protein